MSISANQTYIRIRKLVAGFHALGLQKGDFVCIHFFNKVRKNPSLPRLCSQTKCLGGLLSYVHPRNYSVWWDMGGHKSYRHLIRAPPRSQNLKGQGYHRRTGSHGCYKETRCRARNFKAADVSLHKKDRQTTVERMTWWGFLDHGEQDWIHFDDIEIERKIRLLLMFSSGTTGL